MLHGRDHELARVDALLDGARAGRSGALVITGEPGIGKTAPARPRAGAAAAAAAGPAHARLRVRARAPVRRPVRAARADARRCASASRPCRRARWAPRSRSSRRRRTTRSPCPPRCSACSAPPPRTGRCWRSSTTCSGSIPGSQRAVLFAARRLGAEGIALLLAARPTRRCGSALAGLRVLDVGRLDDASARAVIDEPQRGPLAEGVADELVRTAGGNPLALCELPEALSADQRAGREPPPLRLPPGSGVERAFRHRFEGLDDDVRRALTVVAAFEGGPAAVALGGARAHGPRPAPSSRRARRRGLLRARARRGRLPPPAAALAGLPRRDERRAHGRAPRARRGRHRPVAARVAPVERRARAPTRRPRARSTSPPKARACAARRAPRPRRRARAPS